MQKCISTYIDAHISYVYIYMTHIYICIYIHTRVLKKLDRYTHTCLEIDVHMNVQAIACIHLSSRYIFGIFAWRLWGSECFDYLWPKEGAYVPIMFAQS